MFEIGELVRVIPKTYTDLSKSGFNYPVKWNRCDLETDKHLMLGAIYPVVDIYKDSRGLWYQLLKNGGVNNGGIAAQDILTAESHVKKCPFKVGDIVLFRPRNEIVERELLGGFNKGYNFDDVTRKHKVASILNEYFIFLDYDTESTASSPFCWEDFIFD